MLGLSSSFLDVNGKVNHQNSSDAIWHHNRANQITAWRIQYYSNELISTRNPGQATHCLTYLLSTSSGGLRLISAGSSCSVRYSSAPSEYGRREVEGREDLNVAVMLKFIILRTLSTVKRIRQWGNEEATSLSCYAFAKFFICGTRRKYQMGIISLSAEHNVKHTCRTLGLPRWWIASRTERVPSWRIAEIAWLAVFSEKIRSWKAIRKNINCKIRVAKRHSSNQSNYTLDDNRKGQARRCGDWIRTEGKWDFEAIIWFRETGSRALL